MLRRCVAVGLAAALLAVPAEAHRRQPEVLARMADFARTWSTNNPQALSAFYETHADLINPAGRWAQGRMEIERLFTEEHSTIFKGSRMAIAVDKIRFLEDDLVLVDATATIEGMKTPDGSALPPRAFHLVNVLHRKHERWFCVSSRPYAFQGAPAPEAPPPGAPSPVR